MISEKRVVAVIPARGGSKRLPNKNILPLAGKPLIHWTIQAAKDSHYIDEIIVSTDCEKIQAVAEQAGVSIPSLRPLELASDTATTQSVLLYEIGKMEKSADILIVLQPTSPLRSGVDINCALEAFINRNATSVVSVTECEHSPLWSNTLGEDGNMNGFLNHVTRRSQDLPTFYRLNGAIYIYDIKEYILNNGSKYDEMAYASIMPPNRSIDIDNQIDFELAEFFMRKLYDI